MKNLLAVTREPARELSGGELAHKPRIEVDAVRAAAQHLAYRAALVGMGAEVVVLPPLVRHPDAVFVEDTALVLDEVAILTRPGAPSRMAEVDSVADALAPHRDLVRIEFPATLDGGDVMLVDRTFYVGRSVRTNEQGRVALAQLTAPHGYQVQEVAMTGCLHLKTAVCHLGEGRILVNRAWVDPARFPELEPIDVHPDEPFGANVLCIPAGDASGRLLALASAPRTAEKLAGLGYDVHTVDVSEFEKMEGSLTCLSLLLTHPRP